MSVGFPPVTLCMNLLTPLPNCAGSQVGERRLLAARSPASATRRIHVRWGWENGVCRPRIGHNGGCWVLNDRRARVGSALGLGERHLRAHIGHLHRRHQRRTALLRQRPQPRQQGSGDREKVQHFFGAGIPKIASSCHKSARSRAAGKRRSSRLSSRAACNSAPNRRAQTARQTLSEPSCAGAAGRADCGPLHRLTQYGLCWRFC